MTFIAPSPVLRKTGIYVRSPSWTQLFHASNASLKKLQYRATIFACAGSNSKDTGGNSTSNIDTYNQWIVDKQVARNANETSAVLAASSVTKERRDTSAPPKYDHPTLFQEGAEEYASDMTQKPSDDYKYLVEETKRAGLFMPCMVGTVEGEFLKMVARMKTARRVLDIGTFTGYSALAFADGVVDDGEVITIEADAVTAEVARKVFDNAANGHKVTLLESDARAAVEKMVDDGEMFDIVFLDADKTNYRFYYEVALKLVPKNGIIMADNALCAIVYANDDPAAQSLHEFAQFVRADKRTEHVMLTVREGILIARKI